MTSKFIKGRGQKYLTFGITALEISEKNKDKWLFAVGRQLEIFVFMLSDLLVQCVLLL